MTQKKRQSQTKEADKLCGQIVRSLGHCESGRDAHAGALQWAHGIPRGYRATRWNLGNGFCLCQGCHYYFTRRPLEWEDWLRERWGEDGYRIMRSIALSGERPDMNELLSRLREGAKAA